MIIIFYPILFTPHHHKRIQSLITMTIIKMVFTWSCPIITANYNMNPTYSSPISLHHHLPASHKLYSSRTKQCMYEEDVTADVWTNLCTPTPSSRLSTPISLCPHPVQGCQTPPLHVCILHSHSTVCEESEYDSISF